jgi:vacuolar-type H+-ATPase subunit I/STV1
LRAAIISVISPDPSESTLAAKKQKGRKRARVQASTGEVLTDNEVLQRLKREADNRLEKQLAKKHKQSEKCVRIEPTEKKNTESVKRQC